jgi:hypothetical protein
MELPEGTFKSLTDPKRSGNIFISKKFKTIKEPQYLSPCIMTTVEKIKVTLQFTGEYRNKEIVILIPKSNNDYFAYGMINNEKKYNQKMQKFLNGSILIKYDTENSDKNEKLLYIDDHEYIFNDYNH